MTIRTWLGACLGVFAGWIGVMALVMVMSDAAPGAVVLLPAEGFIAALPSDAAVMDSGSFWLIVRSDAPGLGRTLYRAGARLVLPAGLPGCFPLPEG